MINIDVVKKNVEIILKSKKVAMLEALNRRYSVIVINTFLKYQPRSINSPGKFWFNRSGQASANIHSDSFRDGHDMGFWLAHGMNYGVWLTLTNDRKHDGLTPIIKAIAPKYLEDVKRLYE